MNSEPSTRPPVDVRAPGSKSLSQRALICAALARGTSRLGGLSDCDDVARMVEALQGLGFRLRREGERIRVQGSGGRIPRREAEIDAGDSGANLRFLLPLLALAGGDFFVRGSRQLLRRPVEPLLDALKLQGVRTRKRPDGIAIRSPGWGGSDAIRVPAGTTSQYLSGFLMGGGCLQDGLRLELQGKPVSRPYIRMTLAVMRRFGVRCSAGGRHIRVFPGGYRGCVYAVEPDASGAAFLGAAAVAAGVPIRLERGDAPRLQGDWVFFDWLKRMGASVKPGGAFLEVAPGPRFRGISLDLRDAPDLVPPLAAAALFARGETRIRGVPHLKHKESDRGAVLSVELAKAGASIAVRGGALRVRPLASGAGRGEGIVLDPHGDHRMAMAFAVAALRIPGIRILDPGCVAKSFPGFFAELRKIGHNTGKCRPPCA